MNPVDDRGTASEPWLVSGLHSQDPMTSTDAQAARGLASGKANAMHITFEPKKTVLFLGIIVACLIVANIIGMVSYYYFGFSRIALFDLDREANVPTLYQSVSLLLCSGLLAVIALARKKQAGRAYLYWAGLAAIFFFLSVDESSGIHERLIIPLRNTLHTSGLLFFAWVIPYGVFLLAVALVYLRFLFSLAPKTRFLIILAGVLYVGGALGCELIGGSWKELHGQANLTYTLITMCEESLEMAGVLVLIYALLSYISSELSGTVIQIASLASIPAPKAP